MITDKLRNLELIRSIEASHDTLLIRVIDLGLNKVEKPWVERVGVFENDGVCAVVLTVSCCRIISANFAEMKFLNFGENANGRWGIPPKVVLQSADS